MGWSKVFFAPAGSRAIDQLDFGRRRARASVLAWFGVMVVAGVAACGIVWGLGRHDEVWKIPRMSGFPGYSITVQVLPPELENLGLLFLVLFPGSHLLSLVAEAVIRRTAYFWRRSRDRARWRMSRMTTLGEAADGQWVHVRGQVSRGAGFTSAGGRAGAVIASCLGSVGEVADRGQRTRHYWELHAVDFRVALEGGEEVAVRVDNATLLDRPRDFPPAILLRRPFSPRAFQQDGPLAPGPQGALIACVYDEQVIASGDWIEVSGLLEHLADPSAEAGPRGTRLRPLLRSAPSQRLLIRAASKCSDTPGAKETQGRRSST